MANFNVEHKVVKRKDRILFRRFSPDGYDHYRIRLSIAGELDKIEYVRYDLHPTFVKPVRLSENRDRGFPIKIWTWGEFEVLVTAYYDDGHEEQVAYDLRYSDELPADDSAYLDETPAEIKGR